jgi:protein-disulfide isomerase
VQGKFWEYHDTLFANQGALAIPDLKRYAGELDLDQAAFDNCLDSSETASLVQQDMADAQRYGISSTPTLFINGRMIAGALPYETFAEIIHDELARQ